jgi:hypothetical protein
MRYRLRTLLIVLAVAPPVLAACWFAFDWSFILLFVCGMIGAAFGAIHALVWRSNT